MNRCRHLHPSHPGYKSLLLWQQAKKAKKPRKK